MDEVHFQQYGSCCLMWIPPETKDPACFTARLDAASGSTLALCACAMASFSSGARRYIQRPDLLELSEAPAGDLRFVGLIFPTQ
jgi:hypothetical protein